MSLILRNIITCEGFRDENKTRMLIMDIVSLIIAIYAGYLSYASNRGIAEPLRVVYSLFAAFFGVFYLVYYFFVVYLSRVFKKK